MHLLKCILSSSRRSPTTKRRARDACAGATSRPNIFSAVNNFFADSPLVNQLKGIMASSSSSDSFHLGSGGSPPPVALNNYALQYDSNRQARQL
ncbi:hypothetical protein MSG28_005668 [Choristoneura fumiferana]|uniref:Uncharacterized protein n=1 Tax=Choristoneura fumiferana TaxID=7141 RepID=A0ACC0KZW2_CHOFU|nr:hypothetical protein MSG28_005668 [Choristoneura fumiferana]